LIGCGRNFAKVFHRFRREILMAIEINGSGMVVEIMDFISRPLFANFLIALAASFAVCLLNIATERWHGRYSLDADIVGIQKVHTKKVPRTGGLALCCGVLAVACYGAFDAPPAGADADARDTMFRLLVCAMPAFVAGIVEDLSKAVPPRTRLFAIFASAGLAVWLLGASLPRLDVWGLNGLLGILPVSIALTTFAVAGVTNSINIIDGFHGVAGMAVVIILAGMGVIAWQAGDMLIVQLAAAAIGATVGFLLLNYPTGRLFMGDGGAYFLGFWAAEIAVLTVVRNPAVNAWQILAIYAYPVIEVVFSMYRRKIIYGTLAGAPDRLHLHSLFYRRYARQKIGGKNHPWLCNAGVACFVATWIGAATCLSVLFGNTIPAALALVLFQCALYVAVYMRLVRGHWGHCWRAAVVFGLRPQPKPCPVEDILIAGAHPI
jgi:UDP-N-acetylmuramyl pentapeptide phosphotransferase/UDP-N-acetylglucosamine-1-phosphate transferase